MYHFVFQGKEIYAEIDVDQSEGKKDDRCCVCRKKGTMQSFFILRDVTAAGADVDPKSDFGIAIEKHVEEQLRVLEGICPDCIDKKLEKWE